MPLIASAQTNDYKKVPAGIHFAICNKVIDLGEQQTSYQGQSKRQRQVYLAFEVPDERLEYERDGETIEGPCSIGKTYTLSLGEKANLRKDLENWRGKMFTEAELQAFDLFQVLGKPCQIQVSHKKGNDGKVYANITGVVSVSKEQASRAKNAIAENVLLAYDTENPDPDVYEQLPKWLKEKIGQIKPQPMTPVASAPASDDGLDDPIPF